VIAANRKKAKRGGFHSQGVPIMKYSDQSYNLRIELDTKQCELTPAEIEKIESALDILRQPIAKFPVSDLYLTIEHHPRSGTYRVKAALQLPGRGLATGGEHEHIFPAVQQCVWRLVQKVAAYEDRMEGVEEKSKREEGKRHDVLPTQTVDSQAVEEAVSAGDYAQFRKLMYVYEEPLRNRIGRWIERYPEVAAQLREQVQLADIVEEVFLTAFDQYDDRPQAVPFSEWLESLIDPSVKLISNATDEELDNISFARTLVGE
jgi:ribosome-associated translation inhibitor RaiA